MAVGEKIRISEALFDNHAPGSLSAPKVTNKNDHTVSACSGVILAGGLGTRFAGHDKALLEVGGRRILDRVMTVFTGLFDEIILVTNHPLRYLEWDVRIVTDLLPVRSSLTGIYTGLFYASNPFVFVTGCDTPFLKKELVELVLARIEPAIDIVMPATAAGMEPLCAVYSKNCLKPAEQHLRQNKLKIQLALRRCRLKTISEKALRRTDGELISFFNVNTPEDLARAQGMLADEKEPADG